MKLNTILLTLAFALTLLPVRLDAGGRVTYVERVRKVQHTDIVGHSHEPRFQVWKCTASNELCERGGFPTR